MKSVVDSTTACEHEVSLHRAAERRQGPGLHRSVACGWADRRCGAAPSESASPAAGEKGRRGWMPTGGRPRR